MVRLAIVGTGGIAQRHISGLLQITNAQVVAMVDANRQRAEASAARMGATVYDTLADCLPLVDGVLIFTPPSTHRALAVEAMRAGKHVLVEKPISINVEDAQIMVEEAKKNGVELMVAFNMRFRPGFIKLCEAAHSGRLGKITGFYSQRLGMGVGTDYNWRTDPKLLCGMSIESLSHDIDMLRFCVGDVAEVAAHTLGSHESLPGFDNNASVTMKLAGGGLANIYASWSSHLSFNSRGVVGIDGTAGVFGSGLWEINEYREQLSGEKSERVERLNDLLDGPSYRDENQHFVDCIEQGKTVGVSGVDGLKALKISHAILKSAKEGVVVKL